ncbi:unnamed protein product [Calypogeia fissa]
MSLPDSVENDGGDEQTNPERREPHDDLQAAASMTAARVCHPSPRKLPLTQSERRFGLLASCWPLSVRKCLLTRKDNVGAKLQPNEHDVAEEAQTFKVIL